MEMSSLTYGPSESQLSRPTVEMPSQALAGTYNDVAYKIISQNLVKFQG